MTQDTVSKQKELGISTENGTTEPNITTQVQVERTEGSRARARRIDMEINYKLAGIPVSLGQVDPECWCLFCISEARRHKRLGKTVVLCAEAQCTSPIHDLAVSTDLIEGNFGGYRIRRVRRPCPRKKLRRR